MRMHFQNENVKILAAFAVVIVLAGATFLRNTVWDTKLSLWTDAVKKSPFKSRSHNNLGNCYMLLGRSHNAIEEYKQSLALDSRNIEAYYNLGMNYEDVGMPGAAVSYYDFFCKNAPPSYERQKNLACSWSAGLRKKIQKGRE